MSEPIVIALLKEKLARFCEYEKLSMQLLENSIDQTEPFLLSKDELIEKIEQLNQQLSLCEYQLTPKIEAYINEIRVKIIEIQRIEAQGFKKVSLEKEILVASMKENNNSPKIQKYMSIKEPELDSGSIYQQET